LLKEREQKIQKRWKEKNTEETSLEKIEKRKGTVFRKTMKLKYISIIHKYYSNNSRNNTPIC